MKKITFAHSKDLNFSSTLKSRVSDYFKENNLSRSGNYKMAIKAIVMLSLGLLPFVVLNSGYVTEIPVLFALYITSALGMSGIGMSVMHDANHNSLTQNKTFNKWMGFSLNLIGGNAEIWKFQHNVLHHTYTNTIENDEDINPPFFLRFSPEAKYYKVHRFQHLYAAFFYGLSTISWAISTDFVRLKRYFAIGLVKSKEEYRKLLTQIIGWKIVYFSYAIVMPIMILPFAWWMTFLAFLSMHFVIGLILTLVFQLAHVVSDADFPVADDNGSIDNNWSIHQLNTTCNFSPNSKFISWCVGGLNYQIEHHLFPDVCHIHYKELSKITKATAAEFNIPYHVNPTFTGAVLDHFGFLKKLGKAEIVY